MNGLDSHHLLRAASNGTTDRLSLIITDPITDTTAQSGASQLPEKKRTTAWPSFGRTGLPSPHVWCLSNSRDGAVPTVSQSLARLRLIEPDFFFFFFFPRLTIPLRLINVKRPAIFTSMYVPGWQGTQIFAMRRQYAIGIPCQTSGKGWMGFSCRARSVLCHFAGLSVSGLAVL